jgi:hypothetical protein
MGRLSLSQQRDLDIRIKELRLKVDNMKQDIYLLSPDVRNILTLLGEIALLLEQKSN